MEKNRIAANIEISLNQTEGRFYFQMKDVDIVNRAIHEVLQEEYFGMSPNSVVVYPDNAIVEADRIFLETTSKVI